jgi:hypothetical protein
MPHKPSAMRKSEPSRKTQALLAAGRGHRHAVGELVPRGALPVSMQSSFPAGRIRGPPKLAQAEADQIVRVISDHGLIKISDLHPNVALRIGQGTKMANMTVAANPNGGTIRELAAATAVEPFVKLDGASAHIGMRRLCHPASARSTQFMPRRRKRYLLCDYRSSLLPTRAWTCYLERTGLPTVDVSWSGRMRPLARTIGTAVRLKFIQFGWRNDLSDVDQHVLPPRQ